MTFHRSRLAALTPWRTARTERVRLADALRDVQQSVAELAADIRAARAELGASHQAWQRDLAALHDGIWASKVVRVGDRLLAGCRHLNLVFLLQANDQLIVPRFVVDGEYEPATTRLLKRIVQPDSVCVDVGANFGYYACLMGHLAWQGQTLAYEADPEMHALLRDNVAINWCEGVVQPINAAVAEHDGMLTLHRWTNRAGNTGVIRPEDVFSPGTGPGSVSFEVQSIALDSLVGQFAKVDVVKIDVEGAESLVIAGMSHFVDHYRPVVIMEWSPSQMIQAGSSPGEVARSLKDWDVDYWAISPDGQLVPIDAPMLETLTFQNIVMTPAGAA